MRHALGSLEDLERTFCLTESERRGATRAIAGGFPISITPYYASLADPRDPECPIRKQCVPVDDEEVEVPGDLRDPLGEEAHEVAPHLVVGPGLAISLLVFAFNVFGDGLRDRLDPRHRA